MILDLFVSRPDHPLSDAKELRRTLDALPTENAFKAVDEIYGWFESLRHAEGFRAAQLFNVVRQLDDVGSYKVRRLTRDYLYSHRLSKSEERRLWTMCFNYWGEVASLYAQCIELAEASPKDRVTEAMKSVMPLLWARQVAARANQQRWMIYRYEVVGEDLWRGQGFSACGGRRSCAKAASALSGHVGTDERRSAISAIARAVGLVDG